MYVERLHNEFLIFCSSRIEKKDELTYNQVQFKYGIQVKVSFLEWLRKYDSFDLEY